MNLKIATLVTLFLLLIPSVFADIIAIAPSPGEYAVFYLILLIINYVINFILIGIQSKIWLHLGFKKIALGLAIITPIMFVVEGLVLWLIQLGPYSRLYESLVVLLLFSLVNFGIIFANYFLLAKHFWNLDKKQSVRTAIIMGIITNPALYYFFMFLYGNYLYVLFYTPPPPNPYGGPVYPPFPPPTQ
jgi:hypothetical protein